ncbi:MAG: flavin reductase family protein [Lachnospirales bacterium]
MSFRKIDFKELKLNPMEMISKDWWLISAGNQVSGYNTMTASWGHLGAVWERPNRTAHVGLPTTVVYVRPHRYTKEFMDREELYTLCIFDKEYKKQLMQLGIKSGRDSDKVLEVGLTPVFGENYTYFEEAKLVFVCKKIYNAPIVESGFVDKDLIKDNYPEKDFHEMYVGEIVEVLARN